MPPAFQSEIDFEAFSEEAGTVSFQGRLKITFLVSLFSDIYCSFILWLSVARSPVGAGELSLL